MNSTEFKSKIQEILERISPAFEVLGTYASTGKGNPMDVTLAFVEAYDGYQEARDTIAEYHGSPTLNIDGGMTLCSPDGLTVGEEDSQMMAAYSMASSMGMLPPPLMAQLPNFIMQMNHFFIAAQTIEQP